MLQAKQTNCQWIFLRAFTLSTDLWWGQCQSTLSLTPIKPREKFFLLYLTFSRFQEKRLCLHQACPGIFLLSWTSTNAIFLVLTLLLSSFPFLGMKKIIKCTSKFSTSLPGPDSRSGSIGTDSSLLLTAAFCQEKANWDFLLQVKNLKLQFWRKILSSRNEIQVTNSEFFWFVKEKSLDLTQGCAP